MELSVFLAKLFGIYMLILAALMLFRREQFKSIVNEILDSEALLAFSGILNLLAGLAIVIGHPVWELSWRGLITVLGYLTLFRGIAWLAFPVQIHAFAKSFQQNGYWISLFITLILGLYLSYEGFLA